MRTLGARTLGDRLLVSDRVLRNWAATLTYTLGTAADGTNATVNSSTNGSPLPQLTDRFIPNGTGGDFGRSNCLSWLNRTGVTITFDLAQRRVIEDVRIYGTVNVGGGIRTPATLAVLSSPDNSTWTTQASVATPPEVGTTWTWFPALHGVGARYWRVSFNTQASLWVSIGEVEIRGF